MSRDLPRDGHDPVVGAALSEGRTVITGWENWLFCDAVGAPPSYTQVHPGLASVVCLRGIGTGLREMLQMIDATPEDGPMLATSVLGFERPLEVDVPYVVRGRISALEDKEGRSLGPFTLLTVNYSVHDSAERTVLTCTHQFVVPRGTGAA